jgi:hypothetical protein
MYFDMQDRRQTAIGTFLFYTKELSYTWWLKVELFAWCLRTSQMVPIFFCTQNIKKINFQTGFKPINVLLEENILDLINVN